MSIDDDLDTRAAEYVLGTLEPADHAQVAVQVDHDPAMQAAVAAWQRRLGALNTDTSAIEPPAGLWHRIASAIGAPSPAQTAQTIRADDGQWSAVAQGVVKKVLFVDQDAGTESFLLRLDPGAILPAHDHAAVEECLVLEGDVSIGDLHLAAGDFHAVSPGTAHPQAHSVSGAMLYIRGALAHAA